MACPSLTAATLASPLSKGLVRDFFVGTTFGSLAARGWTMADRAAPVLGTGKA